MENRNDFGNDAPEWQAPPPPLVSQQTPEEPPQMSEAATLGNIFFEPGNTFDDLRRKPRFIIALLISLVAISSFTFLFFNKLGDDRMRRATIEQLDKNPSIQSMPPEQKQKQVELSVTIGKYARYAIPLFILISFAIGGLIYWLAGKAMGGSGNYLHGLSVWVYAGFPPILVSMLANLIVLFLKSADDIDIAASQRGLVQASPGFFLDGKEMPVLVTLLNTLDLFQIWGWILAAIGLHRVMKISKGAAWAVVLIMALIGVAWRMVSALMSGTAM